MLKHMNCEKNCYLTRGEKSKAQLLEGRDFRLLFRNLFKVLVLMYITP
jgi:hypothetical protein